MCPSDNKAAFRGAASRLRGAILSVRVEQIPSRELYDPGMVAIPIFPP